MIQNFYRQENHYFRIVAIKDITSGEIFMRRRKFQLAGLKFARIRDACSDRQSRIAGIFPIDMPAGTKLEPDTERKIFSFLNIARNDRDTGNRRAMIILREARHIHNDNKKENTESFHFTMIIRFETTRESVSIR